MNTNHIRLALRHLNTAIRAHVDRTGKTPQRERHAFAILTGARTQIALAQELLTAPRGRSQGRKSSAPRAKSGRGSRHPKKVTSRGRHGSGTLRG